jgi:hypothetical protein
MADRQYMIPILSLENKEYVRGVLGEWVFRAIKNLLEGRSEFVFVVKEDKSYIKYVVRLNCYQNGKEGECVLGRCYLSGSQESSVDDFLVLYGYLDRMEFTRFILEHKDVVTYMFDEVVMRLQGIIDLITEAVMAARCEYQRICDMFKNDVRFLDICEKFFEKKLKEVK